jgi:mRNA-degrading endonuclease YafQ of YafQ-DinJ toxin-antitoxin module
MKLKIDKTFIKGLKRKIKNKKNKDRIEKIIYDKLELNH